MGVKWRRFGPIRERAVTYPLVTLPLFAALLAFGCALVYESWPFTFPWLIIAAGSLLALLSGIQPAIMQEAMPAIARSAAWGAGCGAAVFVVCLIHRGFNRIRTRNRPASPSISDDALD
jgi:hypothetical protein